MTQEKGKKNIPGGWDSMSKGRDAGKRDIGKNYVGYRRSRRQMQKRLP